MQISNGIPVSGNVTPANLATLTGGGATALHSHAGGGAATPQTQTANVTTDANTFLVEHTFDLGHVTVVQITCTILTLTPAGETFGTGSGQIFLLMTGISHSPDNLTFAAASSQTFVGQMGGDAVAQAQINHNVSARFAKVRLEITDTDSGNLYAGANHPTAQVRIDVSYL